MPVQNSINKISAHPDLAKYSAYFQYIKYQLLLLLNYYYYHVGLAIPEINLQPCVTVNTSGTCP